MAHSEGLLIVLVQGHARTRLLPPCLRLVLGFHSTVRRMDRRMDSTMCSRMALNYDDLIY